MAKSPSWKVIHSSNRQNWRTPPELFDRLNDVFNFKVDLASDGDNALCERYYTPFEDSLAQPWHKETKWQWLNPPYGRDLSLWMTKAAVEASKGARVVVLAFSCTDTQWFRTAWDASREIWFFSKRIKFIDPDDPDAKRTPAPKGSALYVFDGLAEQPPKVRLCGLYGDGWVTKKELKRWQHQYRLEV